MTVSLIMVQRNPCNLILCAKYCPGIDRRTFFNANKCYSGNTIAILDENRPKILKHSRIISKIIFDAIFVMFFFLNMSTNGLSIPKEFLSLPIPGKDLSSCKTVFVRVFIQSPLSGPAIE